MISHTTILVCAFKNNVYCVYVYKKNELGYINGDLMAYEHEVGQNLCVPEHVIDGYQSDNAEQFNKD